MGQKSWPAGGCVFVFILAFACLLNIISCSGSGDPPSSFSFPPDLRPLLNAANPLITPTYDGSGQVTHPSVRYFPAGWHGFSYWMVVTPYPNNDASKENPSILVSNDRFHWEVPPSLTNPLALPSAGHLADGDLFYDAVSDQLWVYYLWFSPTTSIHVMRMTSSDGVKWSPPQDLFKAPYYEPVSPTVERLANTYYMWTVKAGSVGCSTPSTQVEYRTSLDGVNWSEPQAADISQPGYVIWHIEVIWVDAKQEFWMLLAAYRSGSDCGGTALFFAKSADGVHWTTYNKPALGTAPGWDSGEIYRSALAYDPATDLLGVWYSARASSVWHVGYTQTFYTQFLDKLQR